MLSHLTIRSLAIIDYLEFDCGSEMTAFTGETGAGKSILVDALGLLVGARPNAEMIRVGTDRAEICGVFEMHSNAPARSWLGEHLLDDNTDECIMRRVIGPGGRSRAFINGRPVPVQALRELGEHLIDIHSQHAHHSLLMRDRQRLIIDDFKGHHELLDRVVETVGRWQVLRRELAAIDTDDTDQASKLDFLRFQLEELEKLECSADEPESLATEQRRLANAETIRDGGYRVLEQIGGDHAQSMVGILADARRELDAIAHHDPRIHQVLELLDTAAIQVTEAAASLRAVTVDLVIDPEQLFAVEQRLGLLHDFARKHRVSPQKLPAVTERMREQITHLASREQRARTIGQDMASVESEYRTLCDQLTRLRRKAAEELGRQVTATMRELGMPGGTFAVDIQPLDADTLSKHGADRVEFIVSAGAGQPPRPLSKIASGGELSRISLAIQLSNVHGSAVPTLVFDEVDVGIGGRVAEIVGRQLRALGASRQVLCVTHLAQVASQAHGQAVVEKLSGHGETPSVGVTPVWGEVRVGEIARMLGGEKITSNTIAHAMEMLNGS